MTDEPVSAKDRQAFSAWLQADPRHKEAFEHAERFWTGLGAFKRADLDAAFFEPSWSERIRAKWWNLRHTPKGNPNRSVPHVLAGSLAATCIVLLIALFGQPGPPSNPPPREYAYATAIGEIRDVQLEDGSRVTLGAATALTFVLSSNPRSVRLDTGEAYFDVAKNPARPFEVNADDLRVTAIGTAFDVRRKGDVTRVTVAEGAVSVSYLQPGNDGERTGQSGVRDSKVITAGQQIAVFAGRGLGAVGEIKPEAIGAWRQNRLVYFDAPLSELVADANRYRHQTITIADESIADLKISATFDSDDIEGMLVALTEVFPVELDYATGDSVLLRARK